MPVTAKDMGRRLKTAFPCSDIRPAVGNRLSMLSHQAGGWKPPFHAQSSGRRLKTAFPCSVIKPAVENRISMLSHQAGG